MNIYIATSWKNNFQDIVVKAFKADGHTVYDFKNPPGSLGFSWKQVTTKPVESLTFSEWKELLKKDRSNEGFANDMKALEECDACILVLPSGRSAHLELGWACGKNKITGVIIPPGHPCEPDLMVKMTSLGLLRLEEAMLKLSYL